MDLRFLLKKKLSQEVELVAVQRALQEVYMLLMNYLTDLFQKKN